MSVREVSFGLSDDRLLLEQLRIAARSDGASPKSFALLLKRVSEERAWEQEGFRTFRAYVEAKEPDGLDMTEAKLLDAARLADIEPLVRMLLDEADLDGPGGDRKSRKTKENQTDNISLIEYGDSESYLRRRLKRDAPDLYRAVSEGTMTAHSAAIRAGMRHRNISIRTDDPESAARTLRKHMPDAIPRLIELLTKED